MSLLNLESVENAEGQVVDIYNQIQQMFGSVPDGFLLHAISPELLKNNWENHTYYLQHSALSSPLLALIRMLVSRDNACDYCIDLNAAMLINTGQFTHEQIDAIKVDPANAPISEKDKAMLLFVLKATQDAKSVTGEDVQQLRDLGWSDRDIYDATAHGARNIAMDAIFNTFKIEY
ncbi:carboxymuconolactone decarboxylase family protein [Hydrogenovibrio sp. JE_KL2]|uniref:carboxymuconolactone decarboxylase family protein n=1 Tax=Hydrogenovibrio sp. JE_KL2 TaxID=2651188 RepID=UPI00128CAF71|nr:hypothetical protein [Hydrogenovibrio sp. JE_KL2]MPQ75852.1 hypothetical protein [Hydrogenovibrio sp. JE_KL2]